MVPRVNRKAMDMLMESLELCIQMGISFLFSFAFNFSSFHSYLSQTGYMEQEEARGSFTDVPGRDTGHAGRSCGLFKNCESLFCKPVTYTILYNKYASPLKNRGKKYLLEGGAFWREVMIFLP